VLSQLTAEAEPGPAVDADTGLLLAAGLGRRSRSVASSPGPLVQVNGAFAVRPVNNKKIFVNERDTSLITDLYGPGLYKSKVRYTTRKVNKVQTAHKAMADTYLENDNLYRDSFLCLINLED
jgi:hypothetical protein